VGFGAQIALFRNLFPEVPIVVIGPSDMAIKVGEQFETYPQLIEVRNQLKQVAREQHALYWDLFDVMGGERSMHAWVTSDPPLAGPDHIHFSPLGAKRVGELLVQAFEAEWALWAGAVQRQLDAKKTARP
jgi:lysophospholipase L1-like esterase